MTEQEMIALRLYNQYLSRPTFTNVSSVVKHLGAVQAQDYAAVKWSLGLRMKDAREKEIEEAYNRGEIIRTHVMRPTWHLVMPEDLRWMEELTAPNVRKLMGHYDRKLEITEELKRQVNEIFTKALREKTYLTREELSTALDQSKIPAKGQRLGHIVMHAELDVVICSGPRRGKQFTYALVDQRIPRIKTIDREEALAKLATMYISSHGPVQIRDFSWWSGLSIKDAMEAFSLVKSQFISGIEDSKEYYFPRDIKTPDSLSLTAYLMSIFDEYIIAYKDRSIFDQENYFNRMITMGSALLNNIVIDGIIVGGWKRVVKKDVIEITLQPFREFTQKEKEAVEEAVEKYGGFHGLRVKICKM